MGSFLGSKKISKIIKNHKKVGYFSHVLGITSRAISPIHWMKFLIGTYMTKMINLPLGHWTILVHVIQCMGDMALKPKIWENSQFLVFFLDGFWDLWSSDMTPYPTPDALWIIILSLGHSIINVPMVNLIQCMDNMTAMAKIYLKNRSFFVIFYIFGAFGAQISTHILLQ